MFKCLLVFAKNYLTTKEESWLHTRHSHYEEKVPLAKNSTARHDRVVWHDPMSDIVETMYLGINLKMKPNYIVFGVILIEKYRKHVGKSFIDQKLK